MLRAILRALPVFLLLSGTAASAQYATVRGFVYDKSNGEPLLFTNVLLKGEKHFASTDENGYFSMNKVEPGSYTISVRVVGYDSLEKSITVKAGQIVTEKLYLSKVAKELKGATVKGRKTEVQNNVRMGLTQLTPKQIERLPAIGGEADLAQYIQVVPGVIFTGDQGGQLYVRGGSPIQNKVLMDGMVLYNPFHSIGLFSVFDNDIIRNADIMTAGFGAEHGGRISSVMDITTRDGNKTRFGGRASVGTFAAKAMVEGPMKRQTDGKGGSSSYLLNFRHSYLDQTSKSLYSYVDTAGLPFKFTDIYGKLSFNGGNGSKFNLFGFNFSDGVEYRQVSDLKWNNYGAGFNFVLVPSGSAVLIDGVFAYSNYKIQLDEADLDPRSSSISNFNGGLTFKYFSGENEIKYGIEVLGFKTDYSFFNSVGNQFQQQESTSELAAFVNYKIKKGALVIDPGVHLHYYASLSVFSPEPRLAAKWNVTDNFRLKGAAGMYSQNLVAANSDRDVVNLFYGFLSSPDNLPETVTLEDGTVRDVKDPLQRANHYVAGFEVDLTPELELNIEGYLKDFKQVTNINRNKLYNDNDQFADKPDELKKDFIVETGKAYGGDMLLKYEKKNTFVWAVYSLTFVDRFDGVRAYNPIWDRRHNVNLVLSQAFGKFDAWKINIRWNYGSGFPFTPTQGYGEELTFNGGIGTDITTANGDLHTFLGDLNSRRLPDYHRLDIGLTKTWRIDEHQKVELDISVTNAYDRQNIFYYDRTRNERKDQLPLLPSAGISYTF